MSTHLILPPPISANRYWRKFNNRMVVSEEAKAYKEAVGWMARASGAEIITGNVAIVIEVYRGAKRGDLDNAIKVILDALQGSMYVDDKQIVEIIARRYDDKVKPRVELWVSEVDA